METNINTHHAIFPRADYKTPLEKLYRGHRRLIIPMFVPAHVALHEAVRPCDKPSPWQMMGAIAVLDNMSTASPTEVLEELASQMSSRPSLVAHFLRQIPFIERGDARRDIRYE